MNNHTRATLLFMGVLVISTYSDLSVPLYTKNKLIFDGLSKQFVYPCQTEGEKVWATYNFAYVMIRHFDNKHVPAIKLLLLFFIMCGFYATPQNC